MRSCKGRDLFARRGSHIEGDPLKQRPLLGPITGQCLPLTRSFPLSFFDLPPQGSGAGRRAALGRPTHGRGRNLSWTHRARAPRSGAQDPPKETAARAARAGTGRSLVRPGHCVLRLMHGRDHHWNQGCQARVRQTRKSHFNRIQSSDGLGWETHMSGPGKW